MKIIDKETSFTFPYLIKRCFKKHHRNFFISVWTIYTKTTETKTELM